MCFVVAVDQSFTMESLLKNLKEQVTCAICLDTFTDPKTITLISLPLPYLSSDVTGGKMAAKFLAPSSSPSLRHLIAIIFVYLVLNFKINTPQDVRRDSTPLFRPERSIFLVPVPEQAQVTIVKQHVRKKKFLSSSISYYPNATSRFQINRISISGDVAINPGPQTAASNTTLRTNARFAREQSLRTIVPLNATTA